MTDYIALSVAILGSSAATVFIQQWFNRGKTVAQSTKIEVEAGAVIFETLKDLIKPMREEIKRLSLAHEECELKNTVLSERMDELEVEIRRLKQAT